MAGQLEEPPIIPIDGLARLDFLASGAPPPNPSELLDSGFAKWLSVWRKEYDLIVLDGPPILPVTDALIVHPLVDITVLLSRMGLTERSQLQRSCRMLTESSKHFVGVIVNGLRKEDESYYGYYGYRKYSYNYGRDDNA